MKYLVLTALIAVVPALFLLKLSGFCFDALRWNSDRELIEAGLQYVVKRRSAAITDVAAYMRDYPQCCSVDRSDTFLQTPFLNALFGKRYYAVSVKYPVSDPGREPYYQSILIMECCQKYVPDSYGMGSSTPVPKGPRPE
ncbi:hypothetical protein [Hyphomicrobium sp. 2TAF46]|uniref:hypothetical protein n=1 Tax=Hyphomicrobium sp. 2TAF46 TaxID=3233019 RepID=UPI003F939C45